MNLTYIRGFEGGIIILYIIDRKNLFIFEGDEIY
jgi:hypothetical protein